MMAEQSTTFGQKITTVTTEFTLPDAMTGEFFLEELLEHHLKIHDQWFFMKTDVYEIFHYLTNLQIISLGRDVEDFCSGELLSLFFARQQALEVNGG